MNKIDIVKIVFFLSFVLGISLVYAGDSMVGAGVFFLLMFVVLGILLKMNLVK